ncbi:MAG: alanyl-tRNA editing protein [Oscillospiraceae bacterium]|nr:alanyl-tRNA editing protein [Oscillospiraceae bacterium]
MTEKLFYKDAYIKEFDAVVLSCEQKGDNFLIELDKTCFYPEGGGQNADIGMIDEAIISDVHEKDGIILHTADRPLEVGSSVHGKIDWLHRFSLMQHHTGEHIVSGIVNKLFGLDNVGFHMGSAMVTVDFNGELKPEDIENVELLANRAVFENIEVTADYPDAETLKAMNYRSKKELSGEVRIVTVPGSDRCACCGTHVAKTGEIGLIKLLSPQRYKGGVRIGMLCGERALADYRRKDGDTAAISHLLSAKQHEVTAAVKRVMDEAEALKQQLSLANGRLFDYIIAGLDKSDKAVCVFVDGVTPNDLRKFGTLAAAARDGFTAVFCGDDQSGYRYAVSVKDGDARAFSKAMHAALGGKGGGNNQMVQGSVTAARAEIERYFSAA